METTTQSEGAIIINNVECRYMASASLMAKKGLTYIDVFGLLPLLHRMSFDAVTQAWDPPNILFTGPKGVGKSLLAAYLAEAMDLPYLSLDCSEDTRERHLRGGFTVAKGGETPFVFGALSNAIQVANEHGAALLAIEEPNALSPQQQKSLNSLTDFRRKVELPEISARLELRAGAKLWVVGTMNPTVYGGPNELNEDLKSRFLEIEVPYPTPVAEKHILRSTLPAGVQLEEGHLDHLVNIAKETRQGATNYALSPRDLIEIVRMLPRVGWEAALWLVAQKFPYGDRAIVIDRIHDITTIKVSGGLLPS